MGTAAADEQPIDQRAALAEAEHLQARQGGLIARRQAAELGLTPTSIARLVRRRTWVRVHDGVFVGHTGPLTWLERAWAAVLWAWPAVLTHESAVRAAEGPGRRGRDDAEIHVAIDRGRRLVAPPGVVIHRTAHLEQRAQWNLGPPRIRYPEAVLDLAAESVDELAAIAVLADACGGRRTTARRLLESLERRSRIERRVWLVGILSDVEQGTCSVLEHGYLDRVERPHGLPVARRQNPRGTRGGGTLQDATYANQGVVVELDGRLFHSSTKARSDDLDRDLDNLVAHEELTLRIGYRQVFRDGCATAAKVAKVLARRGWDGEVLTCPECGVGDQPG